MNLLDYLDAILASQTLDADGPELKALRQHRTDVEALLRSKYPSPTIRYGGSKAKGTMVREAYDLDIICYFENYDSSAGETLEDIYNNIRTVLGKSYYVVPKPSALRLQSPTQVDFHIDVVPGRFTDTSKSDAFLYRSSGEKKRLKTNLDVHLAHVRDSGVREALKLVKLWRVRNQLSVTNFVLELIAIDLLSGKKKDDLAGQMTHFFSKLAAQADTVTPKDPANPEGNDLSDALNPLVRGELKRIANRASGYIANENWEALFGPPPVTSDAEGQRAQLRRVASSVTAPTKPWRR
ncbi:hypothetical protein K8640_41335 [Myxococcus sp. XM-1-1-1]|uniref:hypothetical protein n=1 Tax=Myxococcus sp. XM-1-1-1 TaxID=2874602 RepID=UPI001CC01A2C|nr:hypothetical protein [Myxococcus sp. XM-1-1-1]MBZ4414679.1 hypothetical protein [Myxococcus sp. XM-1-1-1]